MKKLFSLLLLLFIICLLPSCEDDSKTPDFDYVPIVPEPEDDTINVDLSTYIDLSAEGTANCYLVKAAGNYKFIAVMGNSGRLVTNVKKTNVLWESFGTSVRPNVGDIIASVGYYKGYVYFSTPEMFANGNASIAVRNSNDIILWSWHIWCSEEGWNDHVYPNNAGTMMDRNLGATSATPGDVGAVGLLYQWGRKDPFLGGCKTEGYISAQSTTSNWNYASSQSKYFETENPMAYNKDHDTTFGDWRTSDDHKGVQDPCPVGYRVPDGNRNGFWPTALAEMTISDVVKRDAINLGCTWSLPGGVKAWYPNTGFLARDLSIFYEDGGYYWTSNTVLADPYMAYWMNFYDFEGRFYLAPVESSSSPYGLAVRCVKE